MFIRPANMNCLSAGVKGPAPPQFVSGVVLQGLKIFTLRYISKDKHYY